MKQQIAGFEGNSPTSNSNIDLIDTNRFAPDSEPNKKTIEDDGKDYQHPSIVLEST